MPNKPKISPQTTYGDPYPGHGHVDAEHAVNDFMQGFIFGAFSIDAESSIVHCVINPDHFLFELENGFSINTDFPGDFYSTLIASISYFGNFRMTEDCKENDVESYSKLAGKQFDICGGSDYFEDWLDDDFVKIMNYYQISARFHGGHYKEAGGQLG